MLTALVRWWFALALLMLGGVGSFLAHTPMRRRNTWQTCMKNKSGPPEAFWMPD